MVHALKHAGIRVSLFIGAQPAQIEAAAELGAPVVELHTGAWCDALAETARQKPMPNGNCCAPAHCWRRASGLEVHAGHGLDYASAETISALPQIVELNIGHFLIGEAVFEGLAETVKFMRAAMDRGRGMAAEPRMIIGLGSDIVDVRRIERVIARHGDRFLDRVFTAGRAGQGRTARQPHRNLRQAFRRQGGLRQSARHRFPPRRVLARHRRGQSAVGGRPCSSPAGRFCASRRSRRPATTP